MANHVPAHDFGNHASYTDSSALGLCRYMRHDPGNESLYDAEPEKCDAICAISDRDGSYTDSFRPENPRTNPRRRRTNPRNRRSNPAGAQTNPVFATEPERAGCRRQSPFFIFSQRLGRPASAAARLAAPRPTLLRRTTPSVTLTPPPISANIPTTAHLPPPRKDRMGAGRRAFPHPFLLPVTLRSEYRERCRSACSGRRRARA